MKLAPIVALILCSSTVVRAEDARPPEVIEISEDGRLAVVPDGDASASAIARTDAVPFPLTSDWQNTVRRQIGALQVVDMNGDGRLDIVAGLYNSDSFPPYDDWHNLIYYNTGSAPEQVASWVSTDQVSTGDLQVGFINDDEYPDIFAANGGFAMADSVIYFGTAAGPSMTAGWTSNEPGNAWNNYAYLFDVDHDGDTDVITANQGNSPQDPYRPMFMFRNHAGVLETVPSWSADLSIQNFLAMADWDGDGWEDLAVSKWSGFESGIYRNVGGTLLTVPTWTTGAETTDKGVAWSDVDDNGWPDLALGKNPTQLWTNDAGVLSNTWSSSAPFFGHSDLRFADIDCDGDDDLLEIHFSDGRAHIYLNVGGVLDTVPSWTYDAPVVGTAVAVGDINGDRRPDLVLGYAGDPSIRVFYADAPCPADITGGGGCPDGAVDALDFLRLIGQWGSPCGGACDADLTGPGDVPDGNVDALDYLLLIAQWGMPGNCP